MRVAIVGSGIAGLSCAHVLGPHHDVTLFESEPRLGGHANTVTVEDPEAGPLAIDTGFIVHNDRNYPNLVRLFDELGVPVRDTEMSFAVTDPNVGGPRHPFTYRATNLRTLLAEPRNTLRPALWAMLADIGRFHRQANRLLERHEAETGSSTGDLTLAEFLAAGRYGSSFADEYLIPLGASVWSADPDSFDEFPAVSLFRFLRNHGLLSFGNRPQWRTITGGSRVYVQALMQRYPGSLRLGTPVVGITRDERGVTLRTDGPGERFDRVVLACHSGQALGMLDDATVPEKEVLGAITYQPNVATLHTDTSLLSPRRRAWAAWNYTRPLCGERPGRATVTYDLTALQGLVGSRRYLLSLNSEGTIEPRSVLGSFQYSHPVFNTAAMGAQTRFGEIDGTNGTHFCGAYWGYGFHEDGIRSALRVCEKLGVQW